MEAKIKTLASQKDPSDLHRFVQNADAKNLCEFIKNRITHTDFPKLFSSILESFNDTAPSQLKRRKVVEAALTALQTAKITNSQANVIVCRIIVDFPQYSSAHLIKLVEFCEERIRGNDDDFMSWKDILPQLLEVLENRKNLNNNGTEASGKEYKESILKSLYSGQWDTAVLPSLATMFREISMSKEEHGKVVAILCNRLSNMQPNELPPLVHQLLALCRHQHGGILITALCKYFQKQYAKVANADSEQFSEDIGAFSLKDIQEVESTILYHISHAAEVNQNSMKDFVKSLRNITNAPEYVLDPFIMTLLLNLSDIYEDEALEILRLAMSRIIRDNERQKHSAWLNEVLENNCSVSKTLGTVIVNSVKDRHVVVKGLVDLAFVMMGMGSKFGDDNHATVLWEIGNKIIQRLIKKRHEIGPTVMGTLTDKIMCGGGDVSQYTNCLAQMCSKVPMVMFECQVWIITLLEQLLIINANAATQVIFAVLPIVRLRPEIRDTLSMVLRKALYSRETSTRQMAVTGFLQLLKNFKMNSLGALSQSGSCNGGSSTSNTSIHTQASVETHSKRTESNPQLNTLLCYEVLGILKRCFTQQAEVRLCLYEGLSDVIVMNPQLSTYLVDMLLEHFKQYYESDGNILPPLKLDKCTLVRGAESVLQEPIGNLILVMQRIYVQAASGESQEIEKLGFILESLCNRMARAELEHFELEDGIDLYDNVPESQEKLHNLKQMITVYEALIGYRIVTWTRDSASPAHKVYSLFEGYNRLVIRTKPAGKVKKGEGKKKKDKDASDVSFKRPGRNVAIKLLPTILDLDTVSKIVSLLYSETVPWSTNNESRELRMKELFHRYILQTCIQLVQRTKQLKNQDIKKHRKQDVAKCFEIGRILYEKIVSELETIREFDQQTAVLGLECFKELCDLACTTFPSDLENFLKNSGNVDPDAELEAQLMSIITPLKDLLTKVLEEEEDEEAIAKRIPSILMGMLSLLILKLPPESKSVEQTLQWLCELATQKELEHTMAVAVIQLILKVEGCTKEYGENIDKLVDQLCQILGSVDEEEVQPQDEDSSFKILNDQNALQVHSVICSVIKQKLDDTSWFLSRLKAEQMLLTMPGMDVEERREALKNNERKLGYQLYLIVQTLKALTNVCIAPGTNADSVFRNLQNLFATLSAFTKYFHNKSTAQNPVFQAVRFVPLVKLAGRPLAKNVYQLITHIEENQKTKSKSKIVDSYAQRSKVLKETKVIPRVIYELEQFFKNILLLGKKTKIPLEEYVNCSITRDFRIKNPALIKGLETLDVSMLTTQGTNNDATNSSHTSDTSDIETEATPPPSKKQKQKR